MKFIAFGSFDSLFEKASPHACQTKKDALAFSFGCIQFCEIFHICDLKVLPC
jgi:hypothetical protein